MLGGFAAAMLGAATLGLAAGGAAAQEPGRVQVDVHTPEALAAGSDGAMWLAGDKSLARVAMHGGVQDWALPDAARNPPATGLTPLSEGGLGFVVEVTPPASRTPRYRYVEARDRQPLVSRPLPRAAGRGATLAVTPDRRIWFARTCEDVLGRTTPGGEVRIHRLRRLGCRHVDEWLDPWRSGVIRQGPDGVTWLLNRCQGRVVRIDRRERLREWHLPPLCEDDARTVRVLPTAVAFRPDGTLELPGARVTPSGRLVRTAATRIPDARTPDGAAWFARRWDEQLTLRTADGSERTAEAAAPGRLLDWTVGPDGELWHVRLAGDRSGETLGLPEEVTIASAATTGRTRLRGVGSDMFPRESPWDSLYAPLLAAGPDGAVWAAFRYKPTWARTTLVRLPAVDGGGVAQIAIVRVLERSGGRVWLQLACGAQPGRFCTGALGLSARGASIVRGGTRFALAGGTRQTVAVTLTPRAQRLLRRGSLAATARATGEAAATKTVTVPR